MQPRRLRAGEHLRLRCDALDDAGAGVADGPCGRVHVAGALPGELVAATVEHASPHAPAAWARLERVEEAAAERVAPVCPAYGRCGGCPMQHLAYAAQVRWKGEKVAAALGRRPALQAVPVQPCVAAPRPLAYRNQAKYVCGTGPGGRLVLGAYAPRSHALVDMAGCRLVEAPLDRVAAVVRERLEAEGLSPFDERTRVGLLRHVVARANAAGEVLLTLVTAHDRWARAAAFAAELRAAAPELVGVVQNLNGAPGNVVFGREERLLDGRGTIEDVVGGVRVELSSRSFFQINRDVAALAYRALAQAAPPGVGRAVDAYAGAGGIAFTLAPLAGEVVAIEENAAATEAAAAFAARAGEGRVRFVTGDVAEHLAAVGGADLVVLNPPRAGCAPAVLAAVAALRPRVVAYLSCNPETLARDLEALARAGLAVRAVTPYDMLPHTSHVEALAIAVSPGDG